MIARSIADALQYRAGKYPAVFLTGPRQSGKTTLLKSLFPRHRFVSLEDPDYRSALNTDPRGFLASVGSEVIFDEAQRSPELFSYLQGIIDASAQTGRFLLSGSQNFLLMEKITQSLAGRVAVLNLLPFQYAELDAAGQAPPNLDEWLFTGGYPRIYDQIIEPQLYYADYVQTYVERDVRTLTTLENLDTFIRFLRLCAGRIGQVLNYASLANDCGVTVATVRRWLSLLETSFVIFRLPPYYRNFNKRLVKSPKLYFSDTGLACYLLGLSEGAQLESHYMRGLLFENMVINEYRKKCLHAGREAQIYFWRDSNGREIDLLIEQAGRIALCEIKSAATVNQHFLTPLATVGAAADLAGLGGGQRAVVYAGDMSLHFEQGSFVPWREFLGGGWPD